MLTKDQLDELEKAHEVIRHVVGLDKKWEIVFKTPARKDFKQFRAQSQQTPDAQEILLKKCVVYPPADQFDALLDKFPGIAENEDVTRGLKELTGMVGEAQGK